MSLFVKPNGIWYYTFYVGNRRFRKTTGTRSESKAGKIEAVAYAKAVELGPRAVLAKAPTLGDFGAKRFIPWVNESRNLKKKSRRYYLRGWELLKGTSIVGMKLDQITSETIDRLPLKGGKREHLSPSYRNQALRTLSRLLHLAEEWKVIQRAPRVHLETENEREELITPERERLLLAHAGPKLRDVVILCQDTGGRPEEIFRMRIEHIDWGTRTIFNPHGKSKNSKRYFPISDRAEEVLKRRAGERKEGWLFPSKSKSGHLMTVAKSFARARQQAGLPASVVLYSARHTFGTTVLSETKNPAVTMKAMGHGSARMMMRYQHPEYVEAVRCVINRRNEAAGNAVGPTFGPTQQNGARESA